MATKGNTRRTAAPVFALLGVTALLYGLIALNGWGFDPKLGLDLQGGTSVILEPRPIAGGGSVPSGSVNRAVEIIRRRVNEFGVAESEVKRVGDNIEVSIPGGNSEMVRQASQTAQLRFRMVLQAAAPTPLTAETPANGGVSLAPTPSASATASTPPAASPKASASATGRGVTAGLLSQTSGAPAPSPTPAATPPASATPAPEAGGGAEPALAAAFASLDCTNPDQALAAAKADLDPTKPVVLCDEDGAEKFVLGPTQMDGQDVSSAVATLNDTGDWIVQLDLNGNGRRKFSALTAENVGQRFAMVLDGRVVSAPNINEAIPGDTAEISGGFDKKSASDLANVLKFGALPLSFDVLSQDNIPPSLGKDSMRAGVVAGLVGLGAVMLYIIAYYRGLGLVTLVGLGVWSLLNFALVIILGETIGFTLTLAGIAGFIISAGITSDSYIVYFERLKDEAREGRSLQSSADRGFGRAFRTILAADAVSFLAAAILYRFSAGSVRGFAFTLGMSTILDVVIAYMFTRPIVAALSKTKLFASGRFVGIKGAIPIAERTARVSRTKEA